MEMTEIIDRATREALVTHGDAATAEFYRRLTEKRLSTTRCAACGHAQFPPRPFCSRCYSKAVEWIDLPRRGRLFSFTQQDRALRFGKPDVIGYVEMEGFRFLTRIDARIEDLSIGMEVEVDFLEVLPGLVVHQFRPVRPPSAGDTRR